MRFSEDDLKSLLEKGTIKIHGQPPTPPAKPKEESKSKYHANICQADGVKFRSEKERDFYNKLSILMRGGFISGFCLQPKFVLVEGNEEIRAITYSADFVVFHNGKIAANHTYEVVDTKGFESEQWKRTYKMYTLKYPEVGLRVE